MWGHKKQEDDNEAQRRNEDFEAFGESPTDDTTGDCRASHICVGRHAGSMRGYCILRGSHHPHYCGLCNNEFID